MHHSLQDKDGPDFNVVGIHVGKNFFNLNVCCACVHLLQSVNTTNDTFFFVCSKNFIDDEKCLLFEELKEKCGIETM